MLRRKEIAAENTQKFLSFNDFSVISVSSVANSLNGAQNLTWKYRQNRTTSSNIPKLPNLHNLRLGKAIADSKA
jgi:hypothetical protein